MLLENKSLTPNDVVKILKEHGSEITMEQAKLILEFMIEMANISLEIIFHQEKELHNRKTDFLS
jgi:hypothetical protein